MIKWPNCGQSVEENYDVIPLKHSKTRQRYKVRFHQRRPGHMIAHAVNKMGNVTSNGSVIISDIDKPFMTNIKEAVFTAGFAATIECAAIMYNYSSRLEWVFNATNVEQFPGIIVENNKTKYSYSKVLKWENITKNFSGLYRCKSFERNSGNLARILIVQIMVNDSNAPSIQTNFDETSYEKSVGESFKVQCNATGLPKPILIWYKNKKLFKPRKSKNGTRNDIVISEDDFTITFIYLNEKDSGKYECHAKNSIGIAKKKFELVVKGMRDFSKKSLLCIN